MDNKSKSILKRLPLLYNKADLHNPWFLVERSR